MSGEINLILLLLSGVLLAMLSGALTAMQLISYVRSERNGEGDEEAPGPGGRLDSNPGLNYVSVGAGRIAAGFVVALAAGRFAAQHLPGMSGVSVLGFAAACVLLPYWFGNVLALKTPERFAFVTRPVVYPVIYVLWPLSLAFVSLLRRLSPRLATMVAFPVLPFKQRLEVLGFANGAEESDEQSLMESVFEFGDTRVHEVMVPRIHRGSRTLTRSGVRRIDRQDRRCCSRQGHSEKDYR
jgi:CBS domain containing-hemolysin-like protein